MKFSYLAVHLARYSKQIKSRARTRRALAACEAMVPREPDGEVGQAHALRNRLSHEQLEQLRQLYLRGHSARQLATTFGVSESGIPDLLRWMGVSVRKPGDDTPLKRERRAQILAMKAAGLSQRQIARELGVDKGTVRRAVPEGWKE